MKTSVLIAGGGVAGLSAAYHFSRLRLDDYLVLEAEPEVGGASRTLRTEDGFVFDYASHALYTKSPYVAELYREALQGEFLELERNAWVYSNGCFTRFPFQAKLYGLPADIIAECVQDYLQAPRQQSNHAADFAEWLVSAFGNGIARHFMLPFNEKHWKYPLHRMGFRWAIPYIARPSPHDLIRGASAPYEKKYGLNAVFWYPARDGVAAVPNGLLRMLGDRADRVRTHAEIQRVDVNRRAVGLRDGSTIKYTQLLYTLPLKSLQDLLVVEPPASVQQALERLEYNRQYCLCFAVKGKVLDQWMRLYLPEPRFLAHRLGFPQAISLDLAPPGWGSVYAEITEARLPGRPLREAEMIQKTLSDLTEIGVFQPGDTVEYKGRLVLDPAYVIFTMTHQDDVRLIRTYLREHGVTTAGRFGDWRYYAIDHAILSAKAAAERLAAGMQARGHTPRDSTAST